MTDLITWLKEQLAGDRAYWERWLYMHGGAYRGDTYHDDRRLHAREHIDRAGAELAIIETCEALIDLHDLPYGSSYDPRTDGRDWDEFLRDEALASEALGFIELLAAGYRHRPGFREEWLA